MAKLMNKYTINFVYKFRGNYEDFFEKYVPYKSRKITHCAETLAPQTQITLSTMVESSLESSKRFILQRYLAPGKYI